MGSTARNWQARAKPAWWLKAKRTLNLNQASDRKRAETYFVKALEQAREYFGLTEWTIHVYFEKPEETEELAGALVRCEVKYLRARVWWFFQGHIQLEADILITAIHELMHVMHAPFNAHLVRFTRSQDIADEQIAMRLARTTVSSVFPGLDD